VARKTLKLYGLQHLDILRHYRDISDRALHEFSVVGKVLPFRVNNYVLDELIDWSRPDEDPFYRLTMLDRRMLAPSDFDAVDRAMRNGGTGTALADVTAAIHRRLNPHPANQMTTNVPLLNGSGVSGLQHKYTETCLVFPSSGQTCAAYCSFCFRWPQFVGDRSLRMATDESQRFVSYIREHKEITDVLLTGGDPLIMRASVLRRYIEPLLGPDSAHVTTIRIGTKMLGFWPYRFTTDDDADDLIRLLEEVVQSGRHLAIMMHISHPRELETSAARDAVRRLLSIGAVLRSQSPVVRDVNDDAETWRELWTSEVRQGIFPYYMFVLRDTGPRAFFEVPLSRALDIYRGAISQVSGLARSARGPIMSTDMGKISVDGVADFGGTRTFVLSYVQARVPEWVKRPFFARYDEAATWVDGLQPLTSSDRVFLSRPEPRLARAHH